MIWRGSMDVIFRVGPAADRKLRLETWRHTTATIQLLSYHQGVVLDVRVLPRDVCGLAHCQNLHPMSGLAGVVILDGSQLLLYLEETLSKPWSLKRARNTGFRWRYI